MRKETVDVHLGNFTRVRAVVKHEAAGNPGASSPLSACRLPAVGAS